MIVFDLETAPNESEVMRLAKPFPEFVAPPKEFDRNHPFVIEKIGRAKAEKSVEERVEAAREEWDSYRDGAKEAHQSESDAYYAGLMEKTQLDPRFSTICAIGIREGDQGELVFRLTEQERLDWFWKLEPKDGLCFYSGNNDTSIDCMFDYKFLLHRSRVLGVKIPDWAKPHNGRMPFSFRDIAIDYLGTWKYGEYRSANQAAKELGVESYLDKDSLPVTGADFYKEIIGGELSENGRQYLENDLNIEWGIAKALQL